MGNPRGQNNGIQKGGSSGGPMVCIIGGGFGGICAGVKLQSELNYSNFVIYEALEDFGGTWLSNKYPGCACDVLSHLYSFSFEQNPDWSQYHASQPEIWEYLTKVARKHGLYSHAKFNTKVVGVKWMEDRSQWLVTSAKNSDEDDDDEDHVVHHDYFDFIINATGLLRLAHYPKEFDWFKGDKFHTANWNDKVNLENKIVAVVGTGASAVQVVPAIVDKVKTLVLFQRNPSWTFPRFQSKVSDKVKWAFGKFPLLLWLWRCALFLFFELLHNSTSTSPVNVVRSLIIRLSLNQLKAQVQDENLRRQLTPNVPIGCKRILITSDFYPAVCRPNVQLVRDPVAQVRDGSIVTADGTEHKIDVLILATGFRVQDYFSPMKVSGANGQDIMKSWRKHGPSAYLGISSHELPNYFILFGPNSALGHNSIIFILECQVGWLCQVLREMENRKSKRFQVSKWVEEEYMREIQEQNATRSWGSSSITAGSCGSWYTDGKGRVTALYPGNCRSYYQRSRKVDFRTIQFA